MRVHHLDCGTMCPRFSRIVDGRGGLFDRSRLVCHCLALELPSGIALVDTGLGVADVSDPWRRLGAPFMLLAEPRCSLDITAVAQLQKLGIAASDVRHILPTHLDLDHAGGIADFPDATVHVLERERRAAVERPSEIERARYRPRQYEKARFQTYEAEGESWFGFQAVRPLLGTQDEVLIIPLYGHTRGHAGIAVRTPSGWLLHAGDAYYHHDDVHAEPPRCPPALDALQLIMQVDGPARVRNRARLRELVRAQSREITVICAHDALEFDALASAH